MVQTAGKHGEPVQYKEIDFDPCSSHGMFYDRILALFHTWALVSVDSPEWFSYQDCRNFHDYFKQLFFRRDKGQRPPLEWMFRAFLRFMIIILDQVNTFNCTLGAVFENYGRWEFIWSWSAPGGGHGG